MEEAPVGYGRKFYVEALTRHFLRLRGKLLNMADAAGQSEEQRLALKGLIKDFTREEFETVVAEFARYLMAVKILEETDTRESMPSLDYEAYRDSRVPMH